MLLGTVTGVMSASAPLLLSLLLGLPAVESLLGGIWSGGGVRMMITTGPVGEFARMAAPWGRSEASVMNAWEASPLLLVCSCFNRLELEV